MEFVNGERSGAIERAPIPRRVAMFGPSRFLRLLLLVLAAAMIVGKKEEKGATPEQQEEYKAEAPPGIFGFAAGNYNLPTGSPTGSGSPSWGRRMLEDK